MQRERYLDIVKGLGILSIVLLHFLDVHYSGTLRVYMGLYMISVFFVVSGWIDALRPEILSFRELLHKRWKQLGIPYLYWSIAIIAFDAILWICGHYDAYFMGREVYKTLTLRGMGTLWFLPALFGGEILWYYIRKKKSIRLGLFILSLIIFYSWFYSFCFDGKTDSVIRIIEAPFHTVNNIGNACLGVTSGFVFCRLYKKYENRISVYFSGLLGLLVCGFTYWWMCTIHIPIVCDKVVSLLTPFGLILMAKSMQSFHCMGYLDYWGKHSLGLMVTHYSFFLPICVIIQNCINGTDHLRLNGITSLIYFVVVMIFEYCLVSYIERRWPKSLGR